MANDLLLHEHDNHSRHEVGGLRGAGQVMIHSVNAAASAREMRPLFDLFRGKMPVYALDLPGFGWSERRDQKYSPELYAETLIEWMEALGQPVNAVALSRRLSLRREQRCCDQNSSSHWR